MPEPPTYSTAEGAVKELQDKPRAGAASDRVLERLNIRVELEKLDQLLEALKVQYEQFFSGIITVPPDKLHAEVKALRRLILKAPFKNSEMKYRFQSLENRYHTYRSYWERVMRERDAGTYSRDVFKANLRQARANQERFAQTSTGKAQGALHELFRSYEQALQREAGKKVAVDFELFKRLVLQRAKEHKAAHGTANLTFKIVRVGGQLSIQAVPKDTSGVASEH